MRLIVKIKLKKIPCLLFLSLTCIFNLSIGQKISKVTVVSVSLSTTSTFDVSCNLFDSEFDKMKKILSVQENDFTMLYKLLYKSTPKIRNHMDVRGKLLIDFQNKKKKRFCFDEFGVFFDGKEYFENKLLFKFLLKKKLIEE
jgi:hypothetical protein